MKPTRCSLFLTLASLAACGSPAPYVALSFENDAEMKSNVVVSDSALQDVIRVGRPFVERVPGTNQLKVAVPIRNIDDRAIQVLVQVSFYNTQRQPIGDDTNQQLELLGPGSTQTHMVISKREDARDWEMRITWNR